MAGSMAQPPKQPEVEAAGPPAGWMARYGPALRAYFRKRAGNAEAEDLVQDVFVALQARGGLETIEHVDRYIFRVAANVMAARGRPNTWRWSQHAVLDEGRLADELSPERALIAKQTLERLMAGLKAAPPRAAEAFILHRFDEMSYGEIAQQMGISVKAVEVHVRRTLERITALMDAPR